MLLALDLCTIGVPDAAPEPYADTPNRHQLRTRRGHVRYVSAQLRGVMDSGTPGKLHEDERRSKRANGSGDGGPHAAVDTGDAGAFPGVADVLVTPNSV
jgi:hypothetical protein